MKKSSRASIAESEESQETYTVQNEPSSAKARPNDFTPRGKNIPNFKLNSTSPSSAPNADEPPSKKSSKGSSPSVSRSKRRNSATSQLAHEYYSSKLLQKPPSIKSSSAEESNANVPLRYDASLGFALSSKEDEEENGGAKKKDMELIKQFNVSNNNADVTAFAATVPPAKKNKGVATTPQPTTEANKVKDGGKKPAQSKQATKEQVSTKGEGKTAASSKEVKVKTVSTSKAETTTTPSKGGKTATSSKATTANPSKATTATASKATTATTTKGSKIVPLKEGKSAASTKTNKTGAKGDKSNTDSEEGKSASPSKKASKKVKETSNANSPTQQSQTASSEEVEEEEEEEDDGIPPSPPPEFADKKSTKKLSNESRNSHISTGPAIEDDGTAGKAKKVSRNRESFGSGSRRSSKASGSNVPMPHSLPDSKKSSIASQTQTVAFSPPPSPPPQFKDPKPDDSKDFAFSGEGNSLPRTPPPPEKEVNFDESVPPPLTEPVGGSQDGPTAQQEGQDAGGYNLTLPLCNCNNATLVQAQLVNSFETQPPAPCHRSSGGRARGRCPCCRCPPPPPCFTPCSCQRCRVYHYCFNVLNRHTLKAEDMFLGISTYEQKALRSLRQQNKLAGEKINCPTSHIITNCSQNSNDMPGAKNWSSPPEGYQENPRASIGEVSGGNSGAGPLRGVGGMINPWQTEYSSQFVDFSDQIRKSSSKYPSYEEGYGGRFGGGCPGGSGSRQMSWDGSQKKNGALGVNYVQIPEEARRIHLMSKLHSCNNNNLDFKCNYLPSNQYCNWMKLRMSVRRSRCCSIKRGMGCCAEPNLVYDGKGGVRRISRSVSGGRGGRGSKSGSRERGPRAEIINDGYNTSRVFQGGNAGERRAGAGGSGMPGERGGVAGVAGYGGVGGGPVASSGGLGGTVGRVGSNFGGSGMPGQRGGVAGGAGGGYGGASSGVGGAGGSVGRVGSNVGGGAAGGGGYPTASTKFGGTGGGAITATAYGGPNKGGTGPYVGGSGKGAPTNDSNNNFVVGGGLRAGGLLSYITGGSLGPEGAGKGYPDPAETYTGGVPAPAFNNLDDPSRLKVLVTKALQNNNLSGRDTSKLEDVSNYFIGGGAGRNLSGFPSFLNDPSKLKSIERMPGQDNKLLRGGPNRAAIGNAASGFGKGKGTAGGAPGYPAGLVKLADPSKLQTSFEPISGKSKDMSGGGSSRVPFKSSAGYFGKGTGASGSGTPGGEYPGVAGTGAYPGGAGTSGYPGGTATSGYPGGAGAGSSYPGGAGTGGYPGGADTGGYPGGAGKGGYPGGAGAGSGYPGGAGTGGYPRGADASAYPGGAGKGGYPGGAGAGSGYPGDAGTNGYPGGTGTSAYPGGAGAGSGYPGDAGTNGYPGGTGTSAYPGGAGTGTRRYPIPGGAAKRIVYPGYAGRAAAGSGYPGGAGTGSGYPGGGAGAGGGYSAGAREGYPGLTNLEDPSKLKNLESAPGQDKDLYGGRAGRIGTDNTAGGFPKGIGGSVPRFAAVIGYLGGSGAGGAGRGFPVGYPEDAGRGYPGGGRPGYPGLTNLEDISKLKSLEGVPGQDKDLYGGGGAGRMGTDNTVDGFGKGIGGSGYPRDAGAGGGRPGYPGFENLEDPSKLKGQERLPGQDNTAGGFAKGIGGSGYPGDAAAGGGYPGGAGTSGYPGGGRPGYPGFENLEDPSKLKGQERLPGQDNTAGGFGKGVGGSVPGFGPGSGYPVGAGAGGGYPGGAGTSGYPGGGRPGYPGFGNLEDPSKLKGLERLPGQDNTAGGFGKGVGGSVPGFGPRSGYPGGAGAGGGYLGGAGTGGYPGGGRPGYPGFANLEDPSKLKSLERGPGQNQDLYGGRPGRIGDGMDSNSPLFGGGAPAGFPPNLRDPAGNLPGFSGGFPTLSDLAKSALDRMDNNSNFFGGGVPRSGTGYPGAAGAGGGYPWGGGSGKYPGGSASGSGYPEAGRGYPGGGYPGRDGASGGYPGAGSGYPEGGRPGYPGFANLEDPSKLRGLERVPGRDKDPEGTGGGYPVGGYPGDSGARTSGYPGDTGAGGGYPGGDGTSRGYPGSGAGAGYPDGSNEFDDPAKLRALERVPRQGTDFYGRGPGLADKDPIPSFVAGAGNGYPEYPGGAGSDYPGGAVTRYPGGTGRDFPGDATDFDDPSKLKNLERVPRQNNEFSGPAGPTGFSSDGYPGGMPGDDNDFGRLRAPERVGRQNNDFDLSGGQPFGPDSGVVGGIPGDDDNGVGRLRILERVGRQNNEFGGPGGGPAGSTPGALGGMPDDELGRLRALERVGRQNNDWGGTLGGPVGAGPDDLAMMLDDMEFGRFRTLERVGRQDNDWGGSLGGPLDEPTSDNLGGEESSDDDEGVLRVRRLERVRRSNNDWGGSGVGSDNVFKASLDPDKRGLKPLEKVPRQTLELPIKNKDSNKRDPDDLFKFYKDKSDQNKPPPKKPAEKPKPKPKPKSKPKPPPPPPPPPKKQPPPPKPKSKPKPKKKPSASSSESSDSFVMVKVTKTVRKSMAVHEEGEDEEEAPKADASKQ